MSFASAKNFARVAILSFASAKNFARVASILRYLSCEPGFVLRIIEYAILTHVRVISMTTCESHVKRCPTFPGERQEVHKFCMRHQLRASLQSCLCGVPLPTNDNDVICSELIQHLGLAIAAVRRFEFCILVRICYGAAIPTTRRERDQPTIFRNVSKDRYHH